MTETIIIKRRPWWTSLPEISVEIECAADALPGVKLGLAVKVAFKSGAVLSGADLSGAVLRGADLRDADLRDAVLRGAVLSGAVLRGADLRDADLRDAVLRGADLRGADLRDADLRDADLRDADLSDAKNLGGMVMPDGLTFAEYCRDVVPALLTAGGKTMAEIEASGCWDCHSWENCPMHVAFGVSSTSEMTGTFALYRPRANEFIQFFDARLLPAPWSEAAK